MLVKLYCQHGAQGMLICLAETHCCAPEACSLSTVDVPYIPPRPFCANLAFCQVAFSDGRIGRDTVGRRWACYISTWCFLFLWFHPTNMDEVVTVKEIEIVLPVFSSPSFFYFSWKAIALCTSLPRAYPQMLDQPGIACESYMCYKQGR